MNKINEHLNYIIGITDDDRVLSECNMILNEMEMTDVKEILTREELKFMIDRRDEEINHLINKLIMIKKIINYDLKNNEKEIFIRDAQEILEIIGDLNE